MKNYFENMLNISKYITNNNGEFILDIMYYVLHSTGESQRDFLRNIARTIVDQTGRLFEDTSSHSTPWTLLSETADMLHCYND